MGPWDILFRQYCSVHTLHSLGCCQASPPLLCQASLVYCELLISLDELLENFQHVLYYYSEMSKISFVEPLHSFLRYPCIHQGYMVYVHCIYFHRIVMEEEGQLFQPHRLSQPEDPCYCCHV